MIAMIAVSAQVQQSLKASCPNGNMAMVGKYRRNVITLKDNIRWNLKIFVNLVLVISVRSDVRNLY